MPFEFATATRIVFGAGTLRQLGALVAEMRVRGRVLLVTGVPPESQVGVLEQLAAHGLESEVFAVEGEPTLDLVDRGARLARENQCVLIVGLGGGSAMDAGKAIAALLPNGGDPLDYVEVIGGGRSITQPPAPYIAIPTTAGTGAEVTRNAVLSSHDHKVKVSMRSPLMLPRLALVDPELTYNLPPDITASTGLDALTQVIEPFVCNRANPLTDALCREGMRRAARSLRRAYEQGDDAAAREDMALASLCGGMALANARLGAVHGLAAPIGGQFVAPHGAVCARLLPRVMEINVRALQARQPESEALRRYAEAAQILTGNENAAARDGAAWVQELCAALNIRPLSTYGLTPADFPALIEKAATASSMQGNSIKLTADELHEILERAA